MLSPRDSFRPIPWLIAMVFIGVSSFCLWYLTAGEVEYPIANPGGSFALESPDQQSPYVSIAEHSEREIAAIDGDGQPSVSLIEGQVILPSGVPSTQAHAIGFDVPTGGGAVKRISCAVSSTGSFALSSRDGAELGMVVRTVVADIRHRVLFIGSACIVRGMVVVLPSELRLHGKINGGIEGCTKSLGYALVQECVGTGRAVELGLGVLDGEGRFSVHTSLASASIPVRVRLGCDGTIVALATSVEVLSSDLGLLADMPLRRLDIRVTDDLGMPLGGAELRVAPQESTSNGSVTQARTGADGMAVTAVISGHELWITASLPGFSHCVSRCPASTSEAILVLEKLATNDKIEGVVVDGGGLPIRDALVSALIVTPCTALQTIGPAAVRSGADGSFVLQAGGDVSFELTAFRKDRGLSQVMVVRSGEGPVRVVLEQGARLAIHVTSPMGDPVSEGGELLWSIYSVARRSFVDGAASSPIRTGWVLPGVYQLVVYWPEEDLFCEQGIEVVSDRPPGEIQDLQVVLVAANFITGQLRGEVDLEFRVRNQIPGWPQELVDWLATSTVASDGSFRVLAASRLQVRLSVIDRLEKVIAKREAEVGVPIMIERDTK